MLRNLLCWQLRYWIFIVDMAFKGQDLCLGFDGKPCDFKNHKDMNKKIDKFDLK